MSHQMNICGLLLLIAALMIGSGNLPHSLAQDTGFELAKPVDRPDDSLQVEPFGYAEQTNVGADSSTEAVLEFKVTDISIDRGHLQRRIQAAIQQLKQTPDEKKKQEIKSEMGKLFTRYFDYEIKQREVKLAPLENRVKKLRAQIDKRKAAKEKIIELQLQLMEHQAEGLGFFTEPNSSQLIISSDASGDLRLTSPDRGGVYDEAEPAEPVSNATGFNDSFLNSAPAKPPVKKRRSNRNELNNESFDDFSVD